jgi:hypothetical protein
MYKVSKIKFGTEILFSLFVTLVRINSYFLKLFSEFFLQMLVETHAGRKISSKAQLSLGI